MLKITDLHVHYGAIHALKGVSLSVDDGEIVALIGSNGAGKSTLLKTVSGLLKLTEGEIVFGDTSLVKKDARFVVRQGITHVPEGRHIFPGLTVYENLLMGAYLRKDADGIRDDMEKVYARFPILKQRGKQDASTLSGGEQQMLAMGRALMARPKLLMLDEPSMGLAPLLVNQIFKIIEDINKSGTTILLIEQNARMALEVADRGYVLETGRIVLSGTGKELAASEEVKRAYLGG